MKLCECGCGEPAPDKLDNRPANLVVCQDNIYHHELHRAVP